MTRISVVISRADVADTVEPACRSVAWADELVVVDSGPKDATEAVAKRYGARYVAEPWRGYTEQKRLGVSLCRNDWVLVLDVDEECSPELADEIGRLSEADFERYDLFMMRRRNYVMGRYTRAYDPDWQSRLIHRGRCQWADEAFHDRRLPTDPSRVRRLRGWLDHGRSREAGFSEYFNGRLADERIRVIAEEMHRHGRRCRWGDLVLRPTLAFAKFYLFKRGFLDGKFGLMIAQRAAIAVQLKYAALWAMQNKRTSCTVAPEVSSLPPCGAVPGGGAT